MKVKTFLETKFSHEVFRRSQPEWLRELIDKGAVKVLCEPLDKQFTLISNIYFCRAISAQKLEYED